MEACKVDRNDAISFGLGCAAPICCMWFSTGPMEAVTSAVNCFPLAEAGCVPSKASICSGPLANVREQPRLRAAKGTNRSPVN
jgi:hypothetical protein